MSPKSIFEKERLKKAILISFTKKNGKKSRKKFGLAFDLGLKLICDTPGKKYHTSILRLNPKKGCFKKKKRVVEEQHENTLYRDKNISISSRNFNHFTHSLRLKWPSK